MEIVSREITPGISAFYRPDTSDERALIEVVDKGAYRRKKLGFDVQAGESWLDLGANIGSFAVYCRTRGAMAECYEPDVECFDILVKNAPDFKCINAAVSNHKESDLPFWHSRVKNNHYRGTLLERNLLRKQEGTIQNLYAGFLCDRIFDGVKMDIEGSEGPLIDEWLLPHCSKLCLEYHTSRDKSYENMERRLNILHSKFKIVKYTSEFPKFIKTKGVVKPFQDRVIYCMDPK